MDNQIPDKDFKELYEAIASSIAGSEEIRIIIQDLKERNKINSKSLFALIIKLEELVNGPILPVKPGPFIQSKESNKCLKDMEKYKGPGQFIDGERLSQNEIAFEEFCRKNFDDYKWLKNNKITF